MARGKDAYAIGGSRNNEVFDIIALRTLRRRRVLIHLPGDNQRKDAQQGEEVSDAGTSKLHVEKGWRKEKDTKEVSNGNCESSVTDRHWQEESNVSVSLQGRSTW